MIPNIVHFNYGLVEQNEDFLFVYYVAVLSCKVVNNPDKIYMYYHHEPMGHWWKKTKELCEPVFVEVPTHIGSKVLKKTAHKSDVLRITKLKEMGGVYLDMDTICVKPYAHLLHNKFVIGNEITESGKNMGLCNAIMMTEPNGAFVVDWFNQYEQHFEPDGWQEASTFLPMNLSKWHKPADVTVLTSDAWLLPSWEQTDMIFERPNEIPGELIALHFWNQYTYEKYLKGITNFDWIVYNSQTLYAKLLLNVLQRTINVSVPIKHEEPLLPTPVSNKSQDPLVDMFYSLASDRAQQITILTKMNAICKKLTNKKNSFDIEDFDDFVSVFKMCNSIGLCSILSQFVTICYYLYEDEAHILKHRAYYQKMIKFMIMRVGPIYETINSMNQFVCRNHSYPYAYHDMSNVELFKNIACLQSKLCPDLLWTMQPMKTNKTNKIKVGFVSDFIVKFHSVAKDRIGIIKHLCNDPDFDVKIMTRKTPTAFYEKIMGTNASDVIVTMEDGDLIANRKQIADQQFDIIVYPEIGMCMQTRMIAFSRLAPVQITTWGHSDTSGLPNMDYFVSSKFFNTEEDQAHYSEKLVLFESIGTHYYDVFSHFKEEIQYETNGNGPDANDATNILRKTIIEKTGISNPILYGCIQIFIKTHPLFISMLNEILNADETGVVVILSTHEGDADDVSFKNYVHARIQCKKRLHFIYQVPFLEYIQNMKNCDIILDYFPFGGFNSTIDSFLLGKVCITRPGKRISGKFTQGLYRKMGITEFICDSEPEYVAKAVYYGKNHDERKKYEELIRDNVHKLIQDQESVDEWKTFLKNVHNNPVNVQN